MAQEDPKSRLKQWLASGNARLLPLTFPQRELWENSPIAPGDPANHICSFFEVRGPITPEELRGAVEKIIERQEVLRTSFLPGKDQPLQVVRAAGDAPVISYRELAPAEARPGALEEIMAEGFRKPFDFLGGPLYRLELLKRGADDFVIAFTIHHAIADGWTLGAFVEDLCTAYVMGIRDSGRSVGSTSGIRASLAPLALTYSAWGAADRARWQGRELDSRAEFWRERLSGSKQVFGASGPALKVPLEKWVTSIDGGLPAAVRGLARQSGSTVFTTLLAAFQFALSRWAGVDDTVVGSPVANRNAAAARETMGYFSGVVPLRGTVAADRPFAERLGTVQEETNDAFAHAMPFAELAKAVSGPSGPGGHPVYDTRFAYQNHPVPDIVLPGVTTKLRTVSTGTARFDLGCEVTDDGDGFEVVWLHRPGVVPADGVRDLDRLFRGVLESVCRQPDVRPAALTV